MFRNVLKHFLANGGKVRPYSQDYRKTVLLNFILLVMSIEFFTLCVLNAVIFNLPALVMLNAGGVFIVVGLMVYFRLTGRLVLVSWITVLLSMLMIILLINSVGHQFYALAWVLVVPPLSIYFLGRKWGAISCLVFFGYILTFVVMSMDGWEPAPFLSNSIVNLVIIMLVVLICVFYYEHSYQEVLAWSAEQQHRLEILSSTDALTGLFNRHKLNHLLLKSIAKQNVDHQPFSIMLLDVDSFKAINDEYGHQAGDKVLIGIANALRKSVREHDVVGRWGGDEFLIICPGIGGGSAQLLAMKIKNDIAKAKILDNWVVAISVGVAEYDEGDQERHLLTRADDALYQMKRQ